MNRRSFFKIAGLTFLTPTVCAANVGQLEASINVTSIHLVSEGDTFTLGDEKTVYIATKVNPQSCELRFVKYQ